MQDFELGWVDFRSPIMYNNFRATKVGDKLVSPKMGRPTDNKKGKPIHVRLDEMCENILDQYTQQEKISRAEAIRRGIIKLKNELKNRDVPPDQS